MIRFRVTAEVDLDRLPAADRDEDHVRELLQQLADDTRHQLRSAGHWLPVKITAVRETSLTSVP